MKKEILVLSQLILYVSLCTSLFTQSYSIIQTENEYRLLFEDFHFMSVLTEGGINAYRPHPGLDINGWGTTWYAQPFLAGAVLGHTAIDSVIANGEGISCFSNGLVSKNESDAFGQWNMSIHFEFIPELKKITGTSEYNILLDSNLSPITGDLNLFKIASNYLFDVPLLCNTAYGTTGDMEKAKFYGNSYANLTTWLPTDSNLFVWDFVDTLNIDVEECYNHVDTETQGYYPIEPAYKPGMKVSLNSLDAGLEMIVGGIYDFGLGQDFWEDNVGITPLILASSPQTEFSFTIEFESEVSVVQTAAPLIIPENYSFFDSLEVSIFCDEQDADIYYTMDGSDPTISSVFYSGPLMIDATTMIKAKAYTCGLETSNIVIKEYIKQNQTIAQYPTTQQVCIYPNPFADSFQIECESLDAGRYKLMVLDILGLVLQQREILHPGGNFKTKVYSSDCKLGLLTIVLENSEYRFTKKIIKII